MFIRIEMLHPANIETSYRDSQHGEHKKPSKNVHYGPMEDLYVLICMKT